MLSLFSLAALLGGAAWMLDFSAPEGEGDTTNTMDGTQGDDRLEGGSGNDLIRGLDGDDLLRGEGGADALLGGAGDDVLNGGGGGDLLDGGAGDDRIDAGGGDDVAAGGEGDDTITAGTGADLVRGEAGDDILHGNDGDDILLGGDGDDLLFGDRNNVTFGPGSYEASGDDVLDGGAGDDVLYGLTGDDTLTGGEGEDTFWLGNEYTNAGVATITDFTPGEDLIRIYAPLDDFDPSQLSLTDWEDGQGADLYRNGTLLAHIAGAQGLDVADILTRTEPEPISYTGTEGDDTFDNGTDTAPGIYDLGGGNDSAWGGSDADQMSGGDGNDTLHGGAGDDALDGGNGNDVLRGDAGDDRLSGGGGNDRLGGDAGDDRLDGGAGDDGLEGGGGDDILIGRGGDDHLFGGTGDDTLYGGDGDDTLLGGGGDNVLSGGDGDDYLSDGGQTVPDNADAHSWLNGGDGNDILYGSGASELLGGDGDDVLTYIAHDSGLSGTLTGGAGADAFHISTSGGSNVALITDYNPAEDEIVVHASFPGASAVSALVRVEDWPDGLGADIYLGDTLVARVSGAAGLEADQVRVNASLSNGDDAVSGGVLDDQINGWGGDDVIAGGAGNDTLLGGLGDDTLLGEDGDDRLVGGAGSNTLTGGAGADTFVAGDTFWNGHAHEDGTAQVTDFNPAEDRLEIDVRAITASHPATAADIDRITVADWPDGLGADIFFDGGLVASVAGAQGISRDAIILS